MSLSTEATGDAPARLDALATEKLVESFVGDQQHAVAAAAHALPDIARAVDAAVPRLKAGGRLIYVGAGTSGRLGLLDSVELPPTFSWPKDRSVALLAGGEKAVCEAVEGAEDNAVQGAADIRLANVSNNDVVLLLAASGTTPYAIGALEEAKRRGALTIGIANNPKTPLVEHAELGITLDTGSEVIAGSTRLKAGTAQKITLNAFSSAVMVRLHKVYDNLMVDVRPTNAKLEKRAVRLVMRVASVAEAEAHDVLLKAGMRVKVAIAAIRCGVDVAEAAALLDASDGDLRAVLEGKPRAVDR